MISNVQCGSPADDAGLQQGDEIVLPARRNVSSISDLTSAFAPTTRRTRWTSAGWTRPGDHHTAKITLGSGPLA